MPNNKRDIAPLPDRETLIRFYRTMRLIRRFEEVGADMYREGRVYGYFHPCTGQEAVAAGACGALRRDDYVVSTHRGHGHTIAKGADIRLVMAELFGRAGGLSGGRGGSMHMADTGSGNIGTTGIVGSGIPIAVGVGMGIKQERSDRVVVCFFGDGAANNGVFGESLNLAAIYRLPVIFVVENNCWAATLPVSASTRCERLSDRARGFGLPGETVFGNDPVAVYRAVLKAAARARKGDGPTLIEAQTYRRSGHHINDPGDYMPERELEIWQERDPLDIARDYLSGAGVGSGDVDGIDRSVEVEVGDAVAYALASPEPDVGEFVRDVAGFEGWSE